MKHRRGGRERGNVEAAANAQRPMRGQRRNPRAVMVMTPRGPMHRKQTLKFDNCESAPLSSALACFPAGKARALFRNCGPSALVDGKTSPSGAGVI